MITCKRGEAGDGLMIFIWIAICAVIVGGIVWGTSLFYGNEYDVRGAENAILMGRIEECFSEKFFSEDFNLKVECGLNREVLEEGHLIYIKESGGKREFLIGVSDYRNQCFFNVEENVDRENYPKCLRGSLSFGRKEYDLIVGSNQRRII